MYKSSEQISLPSPWGRAWWGLLGAAHPAELLLEWNGIMPLSTTKYCIFHQIPGSELCLNWYLMNCSPYHLHKAGMSSLCIEQGMSCDLPARSESLVGLGTPGCACCRWDHLVRTGPWHICSSAEVVLSSSFSMPGDAESLDLEVMQKADEKMVFCCNNSLQAPCTDLSDIRCCWFIPKLTSSPWCLVFIPCKLWLLKKKHWLMKLNIKMQKQSPQCPHCLQCVCSGLFSCYTQLRLLERAKCVCYSDHFGFAVLSVSQGRDAWGFRVRLGICYRVSGALQKQLPKVSLKEKERMEEPGVCGHGEIHTCLKCQSAAAGAPAGLCDFRLLGCIHLWAECTPLAPLLCPCCLDLQLRSGSLPQVHLAGILHLLLWIWTVCFYNLPSKNQKSRES